MNLTIPEEFPFTEKERELIKKKLLMFLVWCEPGHCSSCPVRCMTPNLNTPEQCTYNLIDWIMEAHID